MVHIPEEDIKEMEEHAKNNMIIQYIAMMIISSIIIILFLLVMNAGSADACSRDLNELNPVLKMKVEKIKEVANAEGIEFIVTCTYRTQAEQDALYAKGRTAPGRKVTWTKRSKHTARKAVDVAVLNADGTANWNGQAYLRLGAIGKSYGLVWGGDWKVRDYCHFELGDV